LTQVVLPAGTTDAFTYNGDGQRVQKVDSGGTTNFVWDGQNVLLEANAGNVIQAVYTLEPQTYGNLVSQRRGGATSYYHFDGLGSTAQLTGSTGSVTDTCLYDSWGNLLTSTGSTINSFEFAGRSGYVYDTDLSHYYVRNRYYVPAFGRFLSIDPLYKLNIINFNIYSYSNNDPVNNFDPNGLYCVPIFCGAEVGSRVDATLALVKRSYDKLNPVRRTAGCNNLVGQAFRWDMCFEAASPTNCGVPPCERCVMRMDWSPRSRTSNPRSRSPAVGPPALDSGKCFTTGGWGTDSGGERGGVAGA
jgi:RHS repeat-associated protein